MSKNKQCQATRKNGEPCSASANDSGFCFTHNPEFAQERATARRKGGLQKAAPHFADENLCPKRVRSIEGVLTVLDYALQETIGLSNGVQRGRLLVSIAHGYIEAIKTSELEQRLEALEAAMKARKNEQSEKGKENKKWLH
jgi:hypothetical protein